MVIPYRAIEPRNGKGASSRSIQKGNARGKRSLSRELVRIKTLDRSSRDWGRESGLDFEWRWVPDNVAKQLGPSDVFFGIAEFEYAGGWQLRAVAFSNGRFRKSGIRNYGAALTRLEDLAYQRHFHADRASGYCHRLTPVR